MNSEFISRIDHLISIPNYDYFLACRTGSFGLISLLNSSGGIHNYQGDLKNIQYLININDPGFCRNIAFLADGGFLASGHFSHHPGIARFNKNYQIISSFSNNLSGHIGIEATITKMVLLNDGTILLDVYTEPEEFILRINQEGNFISKFSFDSINMLSILPGDRGMIWNDRSIRSCYGKNTDNIKKDLNSFLKETDISEKDFLRGMIYQDDIVKVSDNNYFIFGNFLINGECVYMIKVNNQFQIDWEFLKNTLEIPVLHGDSTGFENAFTLANGKIFITIQDNSGETVKQRMFVLNKNGTISRDETNRLKEYGNNHIFLPISASAYSQKTNSILFCQEFPKESGAETDCYYKICSCQL